ncbi:MAG: hemolysin-type calcium binding protein [Gammaproteobacteria bacterium]|nr:MAG: hemolysin-type calcium binding protein [Gammaproteobacteria bacterium]
MIQAWSDTSPMATSASGAYAGHPLTLTFAGITSGTPEYQAWLDKLTVLEHFNGRTFRQVPTGTDPVTLTWTSEQLTLLNQSYTALQESVYGALALQTRLTPYLDAITFTYDGSAIRMDVSAMNSALLTYAQTDAYNAVADLLDLKRYGATMLDTTGWTPFVTLSHLLDTATLTPEIQGRLTAEGIQYIGAAAASYSVATTSGATVLGNSLANTLSGNSGNDTLEGGDGDDVLTGNDGNDVLVLRIQPR